MLKKAADKGHPIARSNLAKWYQQGIGTTKDCKEALKLYTEGVAINFDRSINGLGDLYYVGCDSIQQDYMKAMEYYKIAAKQNNIYSQNMIGYMYHFGKGVPVDIDEALIWYTRAADGDHISAFNNLGLIYQKKNNHEKAKEWYVKAAKKNNAYGAYNLGLLFANKEYVNSNLDSANYWYRKASSLEHVGGAQVQLGYNFYIGRGVAKNLDSAFYWYTKSALKDYKVGQYYLAMMYEKGEGCSQDYVKAREWYEKAARQDYALADFAIGNLYYDGKGVPVSYTEAYKWYEQGANKGNSFCQYSLGYMYENGVGRVRDYYKARDWYTKAALQEHSNSQVSLGNLYYRGNIGKDYYKAFYWTEKAAKKDNVSGQYNLGLYYYYGIGTSLNKRNAEYWFTKACNQKYEKACNMLTKIKK
jgi:hypothetical protein